MKAKGAISSRPVSKLDENAQEMSASDSAAQEVYQLRDNDSINITKLPSPARMTAGENAVWLNMRYVAIARDPVATLFESYLHSASANRTDP